MNVTLILGNGFDLNMGLPTAYSDFYKYYMLVDSPKSTYLIKQGIGEKPQTWADLEKSLGEISKQYGQDSDAYIEAFENVRDELAKYLTAVDEYEILGMEKMAVHFLRDILDIGRFLDNKPKQEYRDFLKGLNSIDDVELTVVNFNYTTTIEKLMNVKNEYAMPPKKVTFHEVIHVHQNLDTGILMGVNDVSQISNEAYAKEFAVRARIVKPFINEMFAAGNDHRCHDAISNADVVILFGTSFGETDELWWECLKNVVFNRNVRIVYAPYEKEAAKHLHESNVILKNHYFKKTLAKRLSRGNPMVAQDLYGRIYPIRNNHLFEFGYTRGNIDLARTKIISKIMKRTSLS